MFRLIMTGFAVVATFATLGGFLWFFIKFLREKKVSPLTGGKIQDLTK